MGINLSVRQAQHRARLNKRDWARDATDRARGDHGVLNGETFFIYNVITSYKESWYGSALLTHMLFNGVAVQRDADILQNCKKLESG